MEIEQLETDATLLATWNMAGLAPEDHLQALTLVFLSVGTGSEFLWLLWKRVTMVI